MDINKAIEKFAYSVMRFDKKFGVIALQPVAAIDPPFVLGKTLTVWFERMELRDKPETGGSMALKLFPLEMLVGALSGWRWIRDKSGKQVENESWPKSWVIIADRDGDAVIVDSDSADGIVHGSIQMRSFAMADSLASFLVAVAACMDIEREKFDYEVMDEDFNLIDPYLVDVRAVVEAELGKDNTPGFLKFFFG